MAANLDLARSAYDLLVNKNPEGLTRDQLRRLLKTDDRSARDAVNACRVRAATLPHPTTGKCYVVGFDPSISRYVAAKTPEQARIVIQYQESRTIDLNRAIDAQKVAFETSFGMPYKMSEQNGLYD